MKRIGCGVLLEILAIVGLMVFVVLPSIIALEDMPAMHDVLQDVLCQTPETIRVERHTYSRRPGETSYSATYYCDNETRERDVSDRAMIIGIVIFVVPLMLGIFAIIWGSTSFARRRIATSVSVFDLSGMGVDVISSLAGNRGSPAERLKILKKAYDEGLITESEYETKRQSILNEM